MPSVKSSVVAFEVIRPDVALRTPVVRFETYIPLLAYILAVLFPAPTPYPITISLLDEPLDVFAPAPNNTLYEPVVKGVAPRPAFVPIIVFIVPVVTYVPACAPNAVL